MKKTSYTTITGHHEHSDEFPKYCSVKHIYVYVRRWEASDASKGEDLQCHLMLLNLKKLRKHLQEIKLQF